MYKKVIAAVAVVFFALPAAAKVTPEEAAHLGKDLTPVGAERAGNKEGTIPEWTPEPQHGKASG